MKLLHIDSSVLGAHSVSRVLSAEVVAEWRRAHPGTTVEYLDLSQDAPGHFGPDAIGPKVGQQDVPSLTQRRENELTEKLLSQFLAADVLVIGAPLYNFSVPSQLKAWIDRLAIPGRTFKYGEKGAMGLLSGKTVIVVSTRGGMYSTTEAGQAAEHQESYLKVIFGFFGITDVRFVRAEGLGMGEAAKAAALVSARKDIQNVLGTAANQDVAAKVA